MWACVYDSYVVLMIKDVISTTCWNAENRQLNSKGYE